MLYIAWDSKRRSRTAEPIRQERTILSQFLEWDGIKPFFSVPVFLNECHAASLKEKAVIIYWKKLIKTEENLINEALFCTQITPKCIWQPGSAGTRWGSLQRSPELLLNLEGQLLRGRKVKKRQGRKGWKGRKGKGMGRERKERGVLSVPDSQVSAVHDAYYRIFTSFHFILMTFHRCHVVIYASTMQDCEIEEN